MILVPVKNLWQAKQRLRTVLEQSTCTELARAMLADVLGAIAEYHGDEVGLVTSDPYAVELGDAYRFEIIRDDTNLSETDAIRMATEVCVSRGCTSTLVVPGDVPLIEPQDLLTIYRSAPDQGSVIVPSRDKRGTNAILRRPAALFSLRFGNDSFIPHLGAAIATNTSSVVLSLPRLALDIDTPEDLEELVQSPGEKRSQRLARKLGFPSARGAACLPEVEEGRTRPATAKM